VVVGNPIDVYLAALVPPGPRIDFCRLSDT
jgi:hypothetical protein